MLKLYENIKKYRLQADMSQAELARRTGYTDRSSIAKVEKGLVDLSQSKIKQFAEALGVTSSQLLGWDGAEQEEISPAEADEMQMLLSKLSDEKKKQLVQYALFLLSQPD